MENIYSKMNSTKPEEKQKNDKKKIQNIILIISIIYFLFILEESDDTSRKRFYKLLILISSIFLILTNQKFFKEISKQYIYKPLYIRLYGSFPQEKKIDEAKKLLEYTLKRNFENISPNIPSNIPKIIDTRNQNTYNYLDSYMKSTNLPNNQYQKFYNPQEQTKLHSSSVFQAESQKYYPNNIKDNRFLQQNKFNFDKSNESNLYSTSQFTRFPGYTPNIYDINLQNKKNLSTIYEDESNYSSTTYRYYQQLKDSKKYKNKLDQFDITSYFTDFTKIDESQQKIIGYEYNNINRFIDNTKSFFFEEKIPYLLNYHFENFDNINKIFLETLKIQLVARMQEENSNKNFEDEMYKTFGDSSLNFSSDIYNNNFPGKSENFYEQRDKGSNYQNINKNFLEYDKFLRTENDRKDFYAGSFTKKEERNKIKFQVFFGDEKNIKFLISLIDTKLFNLLKNKTNYNIGNINTENINTNPYTTRDAYNLDNQSIIFFY